MKPSRHLELGHHARSTPVDCESKWLLGITDLKCRIIRAVKRIAPTAVVRFPSHFMVGRDEGTVNVYWVPNHLKYEVADVLHDPDIFGSGCIIALVRNEATTEAFYPNIPRE